MATVTPDNLDSKGRLLDHKSRPPIEQMSDIEMIEENCRNLRNVSDIMDSLGKDPASFIRALMQGGILRG